MNALLFEYPQLLFQHRPNVDSLYCRSLKRFAICKVNLIAVDAMVVLFCQEEIVIGCQRAWIWLLRSDWFGWMLAI